MLFSKFGLTIVMEFRDFLLVNCVWGENSLIDSIILSKKKFDKDYGDSYKYQEYHPYEKIHIDYKHSHY